MLLKANLKDFEEKMMHFPKTKSRDPATETPELPFRVSHRRALLQCLLPAVYSRLFTLFRHSDHTLSESRTHAAAARAHGKDWNSAPRV